MYRIIQQNHQRHVIDQDGKKVQSFRKYEEAVEFMKNISFMYS